MSAPKEIAIPGTSGLSNNGNTCYVNAAIQMLSHIHPFTQYLFGNEDEIKSILLKNAPTIYGNDNCMFVDTEIIDKIKSNKYVPTMLTAEEATKILNGTMTFRLLSLLGTLWAENQIFVPTAFLLVFKTARRQFFTGGEQHDAEEALRMILENIQDELKQTKRVTLGAMLPEVNDLIKCRNAKHEPGISDIEQKTRNKHYTEKKKNVSSDILIHYRANRKIISYYRENYSKVTEIFTGFYHEIMRCPNCKYTTHKFPPFQTISLSIPKHSVRKYGTRDVTIENCMKEYSSVEILDEDNAWRCECCNILVRATRQNLIWKAPPVLTLQLKRFDLMTNMKNNTHVHYPLNDLDIAPMMTPYMNQKCTKYKLQSVIIHTGTATEGHYTNFSHHPDSNTWINFDDDSNNSIPEFSVDSRNAYVLMYYRNDLVINNNK
jgi:ubiquitin C-terminal hydrolase